MPYNKLNNLLETPINTSATSTSAMASRNRASHLQPFSSSPIASNLPPPRYSLDGSLEMQDICDSFRKGVTVEAAEKEGIAKWKEDHMLTTTKQLERLLSSVTQKDVLDLRPDGFTKDPVLISLAKAFALLEPTEITVASVASSMVHGYHRVLAKKKLLESLKSQTAEVKEARESISRTSKDIKIQMQVAKDKVQKCADEIVGADTREMKMLSDAIQVEIDDAEAEYARIELMESVCNEAKIDETIAEVKSLYQIVQTLSEELDFAKDLPPSIREVRVLVEERKQQLQQLTDKIEDLVEFQYRRQP